MADVCSYFRRQPDTIRRWVRSGKFPRPRVMRGKWVWDADSLNAFLANQEG